MTALELVPITFREACAFVARFHRHNLPPRGHKFSIGVKNGALVGVIMVGRPVARAFDDGLTAEVNRTCTDGTANANSMLYGAAIRAAKAMGYRCVITYTQEDEPGSSLRAAGFRRVKGLIGREDWVASSGGKPRYNGSATLFGPSTTGGVPRVLWMWP